MQEGNDARGDMLEILNGMDEMTFKDHKIAIEDE